MRIKLYRGSEGHAPVSELATAMPQLPQAADGLHPAEHLLDEFASLLTGGIAGVARGPAIDRALLHFARHARDALGTDSGDEARDVKPLVRADRGRVRRFGQQQQRGVPFRRASRGRHAHVRTAPEGTGSGAGAGS